MCGLLRATGMYYCHSLLSSVIVLYSVCGPRVVSHRVVLFLVTRINLTMKIFCSELLLLTYLIIQSIEMWLCMYCTVQYILSHPNWHLQYVHNHPFQQHHLHIIYMYHLYTSIIDSLGHQYVYHCPFQWTVWIDD